MKKWFYYGLLTALALCLVLVFSACRRAPLYPYQPGVNRYTTDSFKSNGQRIYFTATSSSGQPIIPEGFSMMMHRIACVDCHGPEGKGGQVSMMMQSFDVPDITWSHLTEEEHEESGHEEHPPYTEETVKRAITDGVDPAGEPFDEFMPRWRISEQDLNDLIDFLKELK